METTSTLKLANQEVIKLLAKLRKFNRQRHVAYLQKGPNILSAHYVSRELSASLATAFHLQDTHTFISKETPETYNQTNAHDHLPLLWCFKVKKIIQEKQFAPDTLRAEKNVQ